MKFGLDVSIKNEYADPSKLVELAVEAEDAGWDGFFLQDFLIPDNREQPCIDPWTTLGAIAYATEKIKIGILVTPLPVHRPWILSRQVTTIDHLSKGRMILGVGLGYAPIDFEIVGMETDLKIRAAIADETLELLQLFWSGEEVHYDGKYYQVSGLQQNFKPFNGKSVTIWVGGSVKRKPMERASRFDGVYPMAGSFEDYKKCIELIAEKREIKGYDFAHYLESIENLSTQEETYKIYKDIGVTWIIEGSPIHFENNRDFIKKGPLRI